MKWHRALMYELEADTLEEAQELWDAEGPETGSGVFLVAFGNLEAAVEGQSPDDDGVEVLPLDEPTD